METRIKRLAQFLFDNAKMIETELSKSSHYRALCLQLDMFKNEKPELRLILSYYDETTSHFKLKDDDICLEGFRQLCMQIDYESGIRNLPKPDKVRKTLI